MRYIFFMFHTIQFTERTNEAFVHLGARFMSSHPIAAFGLLFQTPEASARLPLGRGPSHF